MKRQSEDYKARSYNTDSGEKKYTFKYILAKFTKDKE